MKQLLFVGFLWVFVISAFAQSDLISISENDYGRDLLNGKDIIGKEYVFSQRVEQFDLLSNDRMLVQLRAKRRYSDGLKNKGKAFLFNVKNQSVKWEKKMHYKVSWIESYGDVLLYQNTAMGSSRLDIETGEKMWNSKIQLISISEDLKLGITFKNFGNKETMEGIGLIDGKRIWKRKIKRNKDWQEGIWIDDS